MAMQEQDRTEIELATRGVGRLALWTLAWLVTLALASFGPALLWDEQPILTWIAIGVNVIVGIGWIIYHFRYLRGVDELQRKILMDAIAVALGFALVGGCAFAAAGNVGLIDVDGDIAIMTAATGVVYVIAAVVGNLRYR
jgi:hypothetical protein